MDDFRRELCQLERMGNYRTLFAEVFGKLLHAFEQAVIRPLLPLNTVGDSFQQRNLILYCLHIFSSEGGKTLPLSDRSEGALTILRSFEIASKPFTFWDLIILSVFCSVNRKKLLLTFFQGFATALFVPPCTEERLI